MTKENWTTLAFYLKRKEFQLLIEAMEQRELANLHTLQNADPTNVASISKYQALSKNLVSTLRGIAEEAEAHLQD